MSRLSKFWKKVTLKNVPEGSLVLLDGRSLKTPGGLELRVPRPTLAHLIAGEWESQSEQLKSYSLPLVCYSFAHDQKTSLASRAIDACQEDPSRSEIIEKLLKYLHTDATW